MAEFKIGIIGIGTMGGAHADALFAGKLAGAALGAVCDTNPQKIADAKAKFGDKVEYYSDDDEFIRNAKVDAVIVATPHYFHPPLAIKVLQSGRHVLSEKPAGVYTKQVKELIAVAEKSDKMYAIMYNQRTSPLYKKVKELYESGELGELKRVNWIITNWYRAQSYYDSGAWRATWEGEGGGVLLNQCPHNLDLWQWMVGMPKRMRAFMRYGVNRDIEVENDVTAYAEYANGATALFVTSTHEAPGTNRLEISGSMGKLVVEDDKLTFWRNRMPEEEFNKIYKGGFGSPECWKCEIPVKGDYPKHLGVLKMWMEACKTGDKSKMIARGEEGINCVKLFNAMHLSAWTDSWVDIDTMDEDLFKKLLDEKIANSPHTGKTGQSITLNPGETYQ